MVNRYMPFDVEQMDADLGGDYVEYSDYAALEAALERSLLAIDDWLHLFAPELCNPDDVARSRSRVMAVGTLAYIADVQQQNRAALRATLETKGDASEG